MDSRATRDGTVIRRRRCCLKCGHRFTTYETLEKETVRVLKRNGRQEAFDRAKLREGIRQACQKRPVNGEQVDRIVEAVISGIQADDQGMISSKVIAEKALAQLREEDEIAYVRYASVHRRFHDVEDFLQEIQDLAKVRDQRLKTKG